MKELETNIENFLSSLFYLEREAKKEGYDEVSRILRNAIARIDKWISDDSYSSCEEELGSDLYNALLIVTEVRKLDGKQLEKLFNALTSIEDNKLAANNR